MIPHNEELERAMIGTALLDKSIPWAAKHLSTADFYVGVNRAIWAAICALAEDGEPLEISSVFERVNGWPLKMSDLSQMTLGIPIHFAGEKEVQILKSLSALRTLQKGFSDLAEKIETKVPLETIIEQADALISSVKQERQQDQGTSKTLADVYEHDVFPRLDRFVSGEMVKIPFGWEMLDRSTNGGAAPGELVVLGAKPKSGKSALMIQIARQQAERGIGGYVCSREMLNYENALRLIAQTTPYTVNHFRAGLYPETAEKMKSHVRETSGVPLHLDDKAKTVKEIRKELDRIEAAGYDVKSVFVDYVQLMRGMRRFNSTAEALEDIIYDLKDLATERELVVYANAQFNRDGIDSDRPKMSDFKGSSAIEMAANLILFWTVEQDINVTYNGRKGKLWIEAGRNVAYDEFEIIFRGEKALFELL